MTTLHDFWRCVGTVFGLFLLGPHNFMVTALGLCVKWPLGQLYTQTKSHDHEILRALENHPKAIPWEMEIQFRNDVSQA